MAGLAAVGLVGIVVVVQQQGQLLRRLPRNLLRQLDYCKTIRLVVAELAPWWRCFLLVGCLF